MGLAFERLAERIGLVNFPEAPTKVTAAWEGSR